MNNIGQKIPPVTETKARILKHHDQKWLDAKLKEARTKYKNAYPEPLIYWMIAAQNKIEVEDIKASGDGQEGEEVPISSLEDLLQDDDVRAQWTRVDNGKFIQPKSQAKYCIPTAVVMNMFTTTNEKSGKDKMEMLVSDGSGVIKVVAYEKAIQVVAEAKVKIGSVIRLPLLQGRYGYWTRKGGKGNEDEEVLWFNLSLPPFGNVYKLDMPATQILKNLDQVVVKPKDACYVEGIVTSLDPRKQDICTKCFQWYDEKKPEKHGRCKGAEIIEQTSYEGTITTTSSQIHKLVWAPNTKAGEFEIAKPKFKVGDDSLRIFGTLTERSTVMVTGHKVIDPSEINIPDDDDDDEDEEPTTPAKGKKAPAKASKVEPDDADEDEDEDDDAEEAPAPRRRVLSKSKAAPDEDEEDEDDDDEEPVKPTPRRRLVQPSSTDEDEEEQPAPKRRPAKPVDEDEEGEDDEVESPPPRRRKVQEPEKDDEEEDDEPVPLRRRVVTKGKPVQDEEQDEEEPAPAPRRRLAKPAPKEDEDEDDDDEDDEEPVQPAPKKKGKAKADPVTEFIVTALTNFGTPQRTHILAKAAVKADLVECDDPTDAEALQEAFSPHLEAAIDAGAIKWADDKRKTVWIAKEA